LVQASVLLSGSATRWVDFLKRLENRLDRRFFRSRLSGFQTLRCSFPAFCCLPFLAVAVFFLAAGVFNDLFFRQYLTTISRRPLLASSLLKQGNTPGGPPGGSLVRYVIP